MADTDASKVVVGSRANLFAAVLIASIGALTAANPVGAQTAQKEKLDELRSQIESLQKGIEKSEENRTEAADALRKSERAISKANRRLWR